MHSIQVRSNTDDINIASEELNAHFYRRLISRSEKAITRDVPRGFMLICRAIC